MAWRTISPLRFTVGVLVDVSLRSYLSDPTATATVTLDRALPAGLVFTAGVIGGTPSTATAAGDYTATADDGVDSATTSLSIEVIAATFQLQFEIATPEQIGIVVPLAVGLPSVTTATVRFRPAASTTWQQAHPLLRIHPEWISGGAPQAPVDAFAGTIFDLQPGASYGVEVTLTPPTGAPQTVETLVSTRALAPPSGAANVFAIPSDNLQIIFDALVPGDVLELAAGTYNVSGLHLGVSGTAVAPIIIRGVTRNTVVLRNTGRVLQMQGASHVIVEDLTMEGSTTDSGTNASSVGVSFWNGALHEFVTLRRLTIRGIDRPWCTARGAPANCGVWRAPGASGMKSFQFKRTQRKYKTR